MPRRWALTPSGSLSLPLTNPRSFETDINSGATGARHQHHHQGDRRRWPVFASGLGLQASESNLLTLQTLDDQKYQNGMMTPVPVKNIQAFQDEGYQRDLLFMMFLASVQVSERPDRSDRRGGGGALRPGRAGRQPDGGVSFDQQLCAYIASGPYQTLFDPGRTHPADYSFSLRTCQKTRRRGRATPRPAAWCISTMIRRAKAAGESRAIRIRKSVSRSC